MKKKVIFSIFEYEFIIDLEIESKSKSKKVVQNGHTSVFINNNIVVVTN